MEKLSASKSASIDALGEKIKALDDINKQQKKEIEDLNDRNQMLHSQNLQLMQDNQDIMNALAEKNEVIFKLKQMADLKPLEDNIKKWAEGINKGQYEQSYSLLTGQAAMDKDGSTLEDFAYNYKNAIKSIKIKSIKLYVDEMNYEKKSDLIFDVILEIKKTDNTKVSLFDDGMNEKFFTVVYDKGKNDWLISNISSTP